MEGEPQTATFEDLSIDDSLGALARVRQYGTSAIALQRLVHVKMLTEAAESVPYESIQTDLFPLLRALSMDNEWVIRQHLGEQLGGVAAACLREAEGEDGPGYRGIIESILPLIQTLLNDSQDEVRQSSGASLCHICSLLAPEDRGRRALTLALQLAHDDEQEDLRMTAAKLLNDMVEILGPDLCTQFVSPELVSLAEDPVFRVRKAAALALHSACRVAGEADAVDRLLPAFIRLTKDDIYRVRKACAEALVDMSTAVSPGLRGHVLLEVFTRLAGDASKLVRQAAMQQLGPFLSTLPAAKVSDALLEMFAGMAAADTGDPTLDRDMRGYCAYNLPGVMAAVGPSRWRPFLKEAYGRLVRDGVWTVRRTLACSLHEMVRVMGGEGPGPEGGPGKTMEGRRGGGEEGGLAGDAERLEVCGADREWREKGGSSEPMQGGEPRAGGPGDEEDEKGKGVESEVGGRSEGRDGGDEDLMQCPGPERVERELVFALDAFLQDVEDVRMGALQHLAATLALLPPPSRQAYLPVLCELVTRTPAWQWRPRHALARQLPGLLPLYGGRALHAVFGPLAFALLEDPVAAVRAEAVPAFGPLYDAFSREERGEIGAVEGGAEEGEEEGEEEGGREALMGRLLTMAEAESYLRRQLFLRVALTLPSTSSTLPYPCFHRQLLPRLLRLAHDPVPNVRIVLARHVVRLPVWAVEESPALQEALANLLLDANRDVRLSMEHCRANRPELAPFLSHPPASPPPPPPPPLPPSPSCLSPLSLTLESRGRRRSFSTGEELPVLSPPPSLQAASLLDDIHATADPERIQAILSLAREKQAREAAREEEEEEEEEEGQEGEDEGVVDGEKGGTARSTSLPTERGDASGIRAVMEGAGGGGGEQGGRGWGRED